VEVEIVENALEFALLLLGPNGKVAAIVTYEKARAPHCRQSVDPDCDETKHWKHELRQRGRRAVVEERRRHKRKDNGGNIGDVIAISTLQQLGQETEAQDAQGKPATGEGVCAYAAEFASCDEQNDKDAGNEHRGQGRIAAG
jgi:hypothetical protein